MWQRTTLALDVGKDVIYGYLSFDDEVVRSGAKADPIGFVQDLPTRIILDEGQHVPGKHQAIRAANFGVEPLKQMVAAGEEAAATGYLYVSLGVVSDATRDCAAQHDIEVIQAERLTAFFGANAQID